MNWMSGPLFVSGGMRLHTSICQDCLGEEQFLACPPRCHIGCVLFLPARLAMWLFLTILSALSGYIYSSHEILMAPALKAFSSLENTVWYTFLEKWSCNRGCICRCGKPVKRLKDVTHNLVDWLLVCHKPLKIEAQNCVLFIYLFAGCLENKAYFMPKKWYYLIKF